MEAFALYLFKSVVWLTGFALVYLLFLRNERYFVLNRIYLIAGIVASILCPLFTWHYTIVIPFAPSVEVSDLQMTGVISEPDAFPTKTILLYAYMAGALYLLYRIIRQTVTVMGVIRSAEILPYRSAKLIRTAKYPSSFSFFSFVFVNPSSSETETREIVNHEMEHVRQRHWIDLVLFELLCTLQWLNPLCWLYGRFIRQNHEFLADQCALQRSPNPAIYRAALINQLFGAEVISLANSFSYSINKKRFQMMKDTIHPPVRKLKLLLILPLMAGVFYAFATPEYRYVELEKNSTSLQEVTPAIESVTGEIKDTVKSSVTTLEGNFVAPSPMGESSPISDLRYSVKNMKGQFGKGVDIVKGNDISIDLGNTTCAVFIDGKEATKAEFEKLDPNTIASVSILKGESATILYGDKGKNGVILITLKPVNKGIGEVTVTALGNKAGQATLGSTINVQTNTPMQFGNKNGAQPLIVIDGGITENANLKSIPPETIESINVLKGEQATKMYGERGKNGVIVIISKKGASQNSSTNSNILWNSNKDKVYSEVEVMPEFPGGEAALRKFLAYNIKYPHSAVEKSIQGKEFVSFVVTSKGSVADAKIVMGVDPSLDQEALRVVNSMPQWKPGKQGGKDVNVQYTLPINFVLEKGKTDAPAAKDDSEPYTVVEQMPEFPGGEEALRNFLASNIRYPKAAFEKGIEGKVFVRFIVDKTGKVTDAKVARGADPLLDQEALRVVQLLPLWKPGKQDGKDVKVDYTIPINFALEKGKTDAPAAKDNSEPYMVVEQMPEFPGGEEALKAYLASNVKYPVIAIESNIQGKVFVSFVVTKTGSVSNPKVVRRVDPSLDQEAIRVVESMPVWIPGKQNGIEVDVVYTIPINFVLEPKAQPQADPSAQKGKLIIIPNPAQTQVTVTLEGSDYSGKLEVSLVDSYGKLMRKESKNGPSFTLSVNSLTPGTYVVVANDGSKQYQGSLIVKH